MKRIAVIIILISFASVSFAKKDKNAWKNEKTLQSQYSVFKQNLNFWNGSYFLDEIQLNQFYNSITDSISVLKKEVSTKEGQIKSLQNELEAANSLAEENQVKLNESIKLQNSISVLGLNINKNIYSVTMYLFILGVLILAGFVFLLYIKSNKTTSNTKKEYNELKEEFEVHKKNALDRYTKINMELHKTRMELNRK